MAIVELAACQLKGGITASDSELLKNLKEVKRVIEAYSGLTTLFFELVDDPTVMFVVGAWDSKETHEKGFDGSPQQGEILELIKDQLGITWMHYMDVELGDIPVRSPVLAIVKATLPKHVDREGFVSSMQAATEDVDGGPYGAIGAWNIRKDKHEPDVRVHFSGWRSVEEATDGLANIITVAGARPLQTHPTNLFFFLTKPVNLD
ncbi:uncharacterized protein A1O9_01594 [Exophiala aquamarina CBS 119918]|uniref:ABM domain-containing protein n=1 Tax=Exophiala aquamarina CBS 119918 TaxID=1182545 RepID=A0A072PUS6_9EURO|nr:uncharacterized protein A1O9_01594 [Exophiala aquamarina CBS 119918]KEF63616.1 hypothetical protein A1O9_01594 [Exophiala aquamarina CBS 119918]